MSQPINTMYSFPVFTYLQTNSINPYYCPHSFKSQIMHEESSIHHNTNLEMFIQYLLKYPSKMFWYDIFGVQTKVIEKLF